MDKKNILFIAPPFSDEVAVGRTRSMGNVLNVIPPLGLAYIAAVLEQDGFNVEILDCSIPGFSLDDRLRRLEPVLVGISSTTPAFESSMKTAREVRRILKDAVIIIGGSHVTALPGETMGTGLFDLGILGEGEMAFLELARLYRDAARPEKEQLEDVKGIVFRRGKRLIRTGKRELIKDLDSLPFPARHLLPHVSSYSPTPASYRKLPQAHVMTTRGCSFGCTFCDRSIFGRTYRERSAKNVLSEVDRLVREYGVKEIKFFDDNFTLNRKRLYEICRGMRDRKIGWCCLTRVNAVDREMLRFMKRCGCWQVLFGIESGDQETLDRLQKGTKIEEIERAVRWAQEAGLNIRADFLIGAPGETRKTVRKTLDFAKRLNVDFAHFNKFTPYPGTEIYDELTREGYSFDFSKSCSQLDHSIVLYSPKGMRKDELSRLVDRAHKEYYLRPRYMIRQLLGIRSYLDVQRMMRGFFAVFNL